MDFIEKLSSFSGFNTILVIVDHLLKQAIFIPTHDTITSVELACLFVIYVFSKHKVLSHVTSNQVCFPLLLLPRYLSYSGNMIIM